MKLITTHHSKLNRFQLKRVVEVAHSLDIGSNPAPEAIFDPLHQGFNIWCTPADNPGDDWLKVIEYMIPAAYTKPCEFVATAFAEWDDEIEYIVAMKLSTDAYALADHLPKEYTNSLRTRGALRSIHNRPEDVTWAKAKTAWLFQQADLKCPQIIVEEE